VTSARNGSATGGGRKTVSGAAPAVKSGEGYAPRMAGPAPDPVRLERRGPIALLWINNPPVNVLTTAVLEALLQRFREIREDLSIRVVVLASALERVFAAGADLRSMASMGPAEARVHGARGQSVTRAIETLPVPVVAAVGGSCLGGGCEIILACDAVIASESAAFGQPEIRLGIFPGWGGTRRLPRRIGLLRARDWILSGRSIPAREAEGAGLVSRVVPPPDLLPEALRVADEFVSRPALVVAAAKDAVNHAIDPTVDEGLRYELSLWSSLFGTHDQREGMTAFLEKRTPKFLGREPDRLRGARPSGGASTKAPRRHPRPRPGRKKRRQG
jgi:enoyl-CoA hydratase/carnithine racemase